MSKGYKWSAVVLGVLLVVVFAFALFVRIYLSGELLAAWIAPAMEEHLHRNVNLADARVGFRGFHVEGLEIRKKAAGVALLRSEKVQLRWKFKELLKGRIVIHTLLFIKPEITLIRHEDGRLNVSDLMPDKTGSDSAGSSRKQVHAGVPLMLSLLSMENGRLSFVDQSCQPQATLTVSNFRARIEDISVAAAVPFQLEGQIADSKKGAFAVTGTYNPTDDNMEGKLNLKGIDLAYLSPFLARAYPEAVRQGNLTMEATLKTEGYDHLLSQGSLNVSGLKIKKGKKLSDTLHLTADFQVAVARSQQTLKIDDLDLVINGQKTKIQGVLTQWHQQPQIHFTLSSPQINLDEILALLPKSSPSPEVNATNPNQRPVDIVSSSTENVKKAYGAESSVAVSTKTIEQRLEPSKNPEPTRESFADTRRTVETTDEQPAEASELHSTIENVQRNKTFVLNAQGKVHIDWFHYNKLVASNVDFQLTFQDGTLQLEPLAATVYGGILGGEVKANSNLPGPPFESRMYTENILLDEIITAFWPQTSGQWSGSVNLFYKARGVGSDVNALESRTDVNINEAEFSGHPLFVKFAELFKATDLQQLRFSQVTARMFTKQGIATIQRLHLVGPVVQAEGNGTAGLLDKKLEVQLLLQIRAQYVGKIAALRDIATKIADKHGFVQLPLRLRGTFDQPVYELDESWLAKTVKKLGVKAVKKQRKKPAPRPPFSPQQQKQLKEGLKELVQ